jgi:hypothetical protein
MAPVVSKEAKEALESIPDMDFGDAPIEAKSEVAPKRRGRPPGSTNAKKADKTEKPKVKVGLNNAALKQAIEVGGVLPLVIVDKAGFVATKGKFRLMSKVPPQSILECQQTFAQAVGVVELEMTPWQAYGFTLVGAIVGGVLAFAMEALAAAEKKVLDKKPAPSEVPSNGRHPEDLELPRPEVVAA